MQWKVGRPHHLRAESKFVDFVQQLEKILVPLDGLALNEFQQTSTQHHL
jgi:hypothetical protein